MKKKDWISLLLIVLCLGVLAGYQALDNLRTDSVPPQITIADGLLEASVQDPRETLLAGVTAVDDVDGNVTGSLVVESVRLLRSDGTVTVTYAAFDKSGNVAKKTREVFYTDYESPEFSLSRPLLFPQNVNYDVLSIISASDMLDGDISHRIRATVLDEVEAGYSGTHHVQFRVTNNLGETVELVLPVEVYTPGVFEAKMELTDYLIYLEKGDTFDAKRYLKEFSLGRDTISIQGGVTDKMELKVSGLVRANIPGVYEVNYEIRYTVSEQIYTAYSKLIVVVEG